MSASCAEGRLAFGLQPIAAVHSERAPSSALEPKAGSIEYAPRLGSSGGCLVTIKGYYAIGSKRVKLTSLKHLYGRPSIAPYTRN